LRFVSSRAAPRNRNRPETGRFRRMVKTTRWPRALTRRLSLGTDDVTEQVPFAVGEAHHLELLDRREVGRAGVDLDAGHDRGRGEIFQVCRLLHHGCAREVVAALL